jgi:hypothetical protein
MEFKVEIITEKSSPNRQEAFWYHREYIARIQFPNGQKLYAETRGEIELRLEEGGTKFKGNNAVTEAVSLGWTDENLAKLSDDDLTIFMNWFVVVLVDINGETISDDLAVGDTYDEIIELLKEVAEEEFEKIYS